MSIKDELLESLRMLLREYEVALDGKDWQKRNHQLLAQCRAITVYHYRHFITSLRDIDKAEGEFTKGGKLASPGEAPTPAQLREEQRMKKDPKTATEVISKKYAEWLKSYQAAKKSENKAPRLSR